MPYLTVSFIAQIIRLFLVRKMVVLSLRAYFSEVVSRIFLVAVVSAIIPVFAHIVLPKTIISALIIVAISVAFVATSIYFLGLSTGERTLINGRIKSILLKKK